MYEMDDFQKSLRESLRDEAFRAEYEAKELGCKLELAFNGNARYIVTHNAKDFEGVEERFEIKIVTPKQFLNLTKGLKS